MLISDAQVHLWEPEEQDCPWPKGQRPPHRPNGFSPEEMLLEMDAAHVDRAVIAPPHWVGDNNKTALAAAAKYPSRFGVMGRFDPRVPDAPQRLETWLLQEHMLGIRATFHTKPYSDLLDDGSLDWYWGACERFEIPVMALVPGMLRKLLPVLTRHPRLKILIPHMGCVSGLHGPEAFAHLKDLLELAPFPSVSVMVSAVPCYSSEAYPFRDMFPFIKKVYDAFGSRRMFWGSDFTRLPCTYGECVDQFRVNLDFLSSEDRDWILGKGLAETLSWPETLG